MTTFQRIGFLGFLIVAVAAFGGFSLCAADQPAEDGSKVTITFPTEGAKVADSFDLKYELIKGTQAAHAHVFLDKEYQKGFGGTFKGLSKGKHQITVTASTKDHALLAATQTINIDVQ